MVDTVFATEDYYEVLHTFAKSKYDEEYLWDKEDFLETNRADIEAHKEREIEVMYPEFWDVSSTFHTLRQEFVYKVCPRETPQRLKNKPCRSDSPDPDTFNKDTSCMNTV